MATRSALLSFALAAFVVPRAAGRAQSADREPVQVTAGDSVRLQWVGPQRTTGFQWSGRFLGVQDSTVRLLSARGDTLSARREDIRRVEVRFGQRPALVGLARGLATGALIGGLLVGGLWAAACDQASIDEGTIGCPKSRLAAFGLGFTLGAAPAGLLGGIIGGLFPEISGTRHPCLRPRPRLAADAYSRGSASGVSGQVGGRAPAGDACSAAGMRRPRAWRPLRGA